MKEPRRRILFCGPVDSIDEWKKFFSDFETYLYAPSGSEDVNGCVRMYSADELPELDFVVDLYIDRGKKRRYTLNDLDGAINEGVPFLVNICAVTATEIASWLEHPARVAGAALLPTFSQAHIIETCLAHQSSCEIRKKIDSLFSHCEARNVWIRDEIGMVFPRILCMIINEAAIAFNSNIASSDNIDLAMKLGTNYPRGPFEWADAIGWKNVYTILSALHRELGDDRYRPSTYIRMKSLMESNSP